MIRLDLDSAAAELELMPGVTITVMPITAEVIAVAQADPDLVRAVAPLAADPSDGDGDGAAEDDSSVRTLARNPILHVAFSKAIARAAISGWTGVGDADGNVIEVSPKGINRLLDIEPALKAWQVYLAPKLQWMKEGNVSALSPTGTSAGAQTTARDAKSGAPSAPTSSTRPKRAKAPPSGI